MKIFTIGFTQKKAERFFNLLKNAAEAVGDQGRVKVRAQIERLADGQYVSVSVADSGPGIPSELQDQLFSPYFTTKEEGTGLGLAIVQRILHEHGGYATAESLPGQGAVFTLYLPLVPGVVGPDL